MQVVDTYILEDISEALQKAFQREEKPTPSGQYPSQALYDKITHYYSLYTSCHHFGPFTSLIGPAGIGKSFAVSQLAKRLNVYVVYASFEQEGSLSFPRRCPVAQKNYYARDYEQACYWDCYLTLALLETVLCKDVGISPAGFFSLQTMGAYSQYQQKFESEVRGLQLKCMYKQAGSGEARVRLGGVITKRIPRLVQSRTEALSKWKEVLDGDNQNNWIPGTESESEADWRIPRAVICIDKARALLDWPGSPLFRSFMESWRECYRGPTIPGKMDPSNRRGGSFALLVDRTFKFVNTSPLHRPHCSDLEVAPLERRSLNLFPPITAIDTMDIFMDMGEVYPDGSYEACCSLIRAGRPLWGAIMDAGLRPCNMGFFARINISGDSPSGPSPDVRALALLSYRLNFPVVNNALAEKLVSEHLRYILYADETSEIFRTAQPSEPILAGTAASMMSNPEERLKVIQQFLVFSFEGSINFGNLGGRVAAIILLFAYDEALFEHIGAGADPRGIPLETFFMALLNGKLINKMAECMQTDQEMATIWERGLVFCSHFTKLQEVPDEKTPRKGFNRGCAFFLPDNFQGADILIPLDVPQHGMTFFAIQVENGQSGRISRRPDVAKGLGISTPFLGMTMDLRGQHPQGQTVDILQPKLTAQVTRNSANATYKWSSKRKVLHLLAAGLYARVYPVVNLCYGKRDDETERIAPLLRRLLECNAGTSLPNDVDKMYTGRLWPIEWKPDCSNGQ